jgi:hypothetical protein
VQNPGFHFTYASRLPFVSVPTKINALEDTASQLPDFASQFGH